MDDTHRSITTPETDSSTTTTTTSAATVASSDRQQVLLDDLRVQVERLADVVERQNQLLEAALDVDVETEGEEGAPTEASRPIPDGGDTDE